MPNVNRLLALMTVVVLAAPVLIADIGVQRLDGQPEFSEGDALGYFLWKDGDTWKLRWTTFGAEHRFSGRVVVDGGEFDDFKRIDVDAERRIIAAGRRPRVVRGPGGRARGVAPGRPAVVAERTEDRIEQETEQLIQFTTRTDDDLDGLDFKVTDEASLVRFTLLIDGEPRPAEIEVGGDNLKPNEHPLVVRLR